MLTLWFSNFNLNLNSSLLYIYIDQQTSFAQLELEPNQLVDLAGSVGNLGTALKAVSLASSAAKRSLYELM